MQLFTTETKHKKSQLFGTTSTTLLFHLSQPIEVSPFDAETKTTYKWIPKQTAKNVNLGQLGPFNEKNPFFMNFVL